MLSITGFGPAGPIGRKPGKPAGGAAFHLPDSDATPAATETRETAATAPLSRAAPSGADPPAVRDRAARQHGAELLDALADLQRDLLADTNNPAHLERLAALSEQLPQAASFGLRAALQQIAIRAQVELARHEVAASVATTAPNA